MRIGHLLTMSFIGVVCFSVRDTTASAQDRTWLSSLEIDSEITDPNGSLFGNPSGLRASPRGGFVVYDWSGGSFTEFSASGGPLWKVGTLGEGPGEFGRPLDYEFDANGNLLILDDARARLTVLNPSGEVVSTERIHNARQIFPGGFVSKGWAVMPNYGTDSLLWISRNGVHRSLRNPLSFAANIVGEAWATNLEPGGAVVVYRWSGDMVWLRPDGSLKNVTQAVEYTPMPEPVYIDETTLVGRIRGTKVDPEAIQMNTDQPTSDTKRIYLRPVGRTEHARKIIDTYDIDDGEYLGSYKLPHAVNSIAILMDGRLATLDTNLIPTVKFWRIK